MSHITATDVTGDFAVVELGKHFVWISVKEV
jgi:hypothetical protein